MSQLPPWRVAWTPAALDDLVDLADPLVARIRRAVQRYAETRHGDVKKLKGGESTVAPAGQRLAGTLLLRTRDPDRHRVARIQPT